MNIAPRAGFGGVPNAATHQLELVQNIMLTSASFGSRASELALVSGPRCQNFAVVGPLRVSLYAPQVPAKRALRLVRKGDMARALQLLQAEVLLSRHRPEAQQWLQRVIGMSVAHCFRQVCKLRPLLCATYSIAHSDLQDSLRSQIVIQLRLPSQIVCI